MAKRLIVNADDFGIHPAVNEAVSKAYRDGILTSTSLMAGGDYFDEAVSAAKSLAGIGIGVHLTIVGSVKTVLPPSEVPSLTWENGLLCKNYIDLIKRDLKGLINAEEVYSEWDAQIRKVLDTGLPVTHIDGHQHMHMWNHFFPITLALAKKYHIGCMRVPDENLFFGFSVKNAFRFAAKGGLSVMARMHRKELFRQGIFCNDHFWGMLYGGNLNKKRLQKIIQHLGDGVNEIMCHPSADQEAMEKKFHWGYQGEKELQGLLSAEIKKDLIRKGIELISYRDIKD